MSDGSDTLHRQDHHKDDQQYAGADAAAEVAFFRGLQGVTARIHACENLDALMLDAGTDICGALGAVRMTLYGVDSDGAHIVSRVKTGLDGSRAIRLPIDSHSIAGHVARTAEPLQIDDAYDAAALSRIAPELQFRADFDRHTGFRTRQMLVVPIGPLREPARLVGVLQLINRHDGQPFGALEREGALRLAQTLEVAMRQRGGHVAQRPGADGEPYRALVQQGLLEADALHALLADATAPGDAATLQAAMRERFGLTSTQIGQALAQWHGVPYEAFQPRRQRDAALHERVSRAFVVEQQWIALEMIGDALLLMCTDPRRTRESRVVPQLHPRVARCIYAVTTQAEFDQTVSQLYGEATREPALEAMLATLNNSTVASEEAALRPADAVTDASDNELVRFVNRILSDALAQRASDIHIEPQLGAGAVRVRLRVDGLLRHYIDLPARFRQALVARLKILSGLDIAERRRPQDGKMKFRRPGEPDLELRVATLPTAGDVEDVVLRLLHAGASRSLDELDLSVWHRAQLDRLLERPHGLFYVCGPTGSGKTTTLHAVLRQLNQGERKVWTAEDPVEITQPGLRQVQINRKAGIDFATLMRAFLRADPDVIMIGESRDRETVSMSIEASLTGHLVLSTLHTNSAPESVVRLLDMGMDPFNFADALQGILAQRLVRRLCECAQPIAADHNDLRALAQEYQAEISACDVQPDTDAATLALHWREHGTEDGPVHLRRAVGCARCHGSGYSGRLALHELMVVDASLRALVQSRARVAELWRTAAQSGMRTLKMDGIIKVLRGLTDIKQVRTVAGR
ncbi:MAG: GspE/PulE family protein [Betaproteobacteria bacterium]|nr:GspE/PulE family protein [Betaproteobacteria bacterium]NBS47204.1 GspE/PulE family protein [Betaproteobacteria bacterium]